MQQVLSESPGRGKRCSLDLCRLKLGGSAGSEATQQMSQGIPSLAVTCWVLAQLCGGAGSQGAVRVRPAEFIRPKQTKIWPCERKTLHWLGVGGKHFPCPRAIQLSLFQILPGAYLSRVGPLGVGRVGLVYLP